MARPMKAENLPDLATVAEVASVLKVSRQHVYDMIAAGEIPSVRLGTLLRVPKAEFCKRFGLSAAPQSESASALAVALEIIRGSLAQEEAALASRREMVARLGQLIESMSQAQ